MRLWEKLALQIHRKTSEWFQVFLIEKNWNILLVAWRNRGGKTLSMCFFNIFFSFLEEILYKCEN